jgi:hypothetical protein
MGGDVVSRMRGRKIDEAGFDSEKAEIEWSRDRQRWTSNVSRGAFLYRDLVNGKLRCLRMIMAVNMARSKNN